MLDWLFGRRKESKNPPWEGKIPILQAVRERVDSGLGLDDFEFPEEQELEGVPIRFVAGGMDGVGTHHADFREEKTEADIISQLLGSLVRLAKTNSNDARVELYNVCIGQPVASYADSIVEALAKQRKLSTEDVSPHARWLMENSAHREAVKLGIILLGLTGSADDIDDLKMLARHDEFALYVTVAVCNITDDHLDHLWEMAKNVEGWGKIHIVERLAQLVDDRPELQDWLLRHGWSNTIMPEYLAFACAQGGRLLTAISQEEVDEELLDAACQIVNSLLSGGPAEDMDDYEDGAVVVQHLVDHLTEQCHTLSQLDTVRNIHRWLEWPGRREVPQYIKEVHGELFRATEAEIGEIWTERENRGWTPETRQLVAETCQQILSRPAWKQLVIDGFASDEFGQRRLAWSLSRTVSIDLWDKGLERVVKNPDDDWLWDSLLQIDQPDRIGKVLRAAEQLLPLGEISTGPALELGLGKAFRHHSCLDFIVQHMRRQDVFSPLLAATALRSPVIRNRNMAIAALDVHGPDHWNDELNSAFTSALQDEPDAEVKKKLDELRDRYDMG